MRAVSRRLLPVGRLPIEGRQRRRYHEVSGGVSPLSSLGPLLRAVSGDAVLALPSGVSRPVVGSIRPTMAVRLEARGLSVRRLRGRSSRSIAVKVALCRTAAGGVVSREGPQIAEVICGEKALAC